VRLLPIIGTSLGCSAVIAASLSRYVERNLAVTTFWRTDPVGAVWAAANGPGGLFLLLYAVIAFGIVTAAALLSLDAARLRLVRTVTFVAVLSGQEPSAVLAVRSAYSPAGPIAGPIGGRTTTERRRQW